MKININYSREKILTTLSVLRSFVEVSSQIIDRYKNEPTINSIAMKERNNFWYHELIIDVHNRGILSMESAVDHFMVFIDSLSEPAKTIAPWTCLRGLLESSALAIWFLDPNITAMERVGRCFAFRYEGFTEQIKFLQTINQKSDIFNVQQRIIKVEQDAITVGYPKLIDKKGKTNGIAKHMPNIVELIKITLDKESEYRLLSGIAHGHHWVTRQLGFMVKDVSEDKGIVKYLEKYLHPEMFFFATFTAISSSVKVFWCLSSLYGWDLQEIENFIEKIYNSLDYTIEIRFWRSK